MITVMKTRLQHRNIQTSIDVALKVSSLDFSLSVVCDGSEVFIGVALIVSSLDFSLSVVCDVFEVVKAAVVNVGVLSESGTDFVNPY